MSDLIRDNLYLYNKDYLKFRMKYYITETKELLARHKLLTAFIFCLLAPGFQSIKLIGVPFYAIIEPGFSLGTKLAYLMPLLFFLIALTHVQSKFIKGGTFRDYLDTICNTTSHNKIIDTIILLFSLNIVWIAILFGAGRIHQLPSDTVLLFSYYCLYCSVILAIVVLLLNSLYKNAAGVLVLALSLILIAAISIREIWFLNMITSLGMGLLSVGIALKVQPCKKNIKYLRFFNKEQNDQLTIFSFFRLLFLT